MGTDRLIERDVDFDNFLMDLNAGKITQPLKIYFSTNYMDIDITLQKLVIVAKKLFLPLTLEFFLVKWKKQYSQHLIELVKEMTQPLKLEFRYCHHLTSTNACSLAGVLKARNIPINLGFWGKYIGDKPTKHLAEALQGIHPVKLYLDQPYDPDKNSSRYNEKGKQYLEEAVKSGKCSYGTYVYGLGFNSALCEKNNINKQEEAAEKTCADKGATVDLKLQKNSVVENGLFARKKSNSDVSTNDKKILSQCSCVMM